MDYATKQILNAKFDKVTTTMSGAIFAAKGDIGILGTDADGFYIVDAATMVPNDGARRMPFERAVENALLIA